MYAFKRLFTDKNMIFPYFFAVFAILISISKPSDVPVGHLKPLGGHRPPETDLIDDVDEWPNPREFWEKFVKPSRALVVRGGAKSSKAFTAWTDEYLVKNYGDLELRLEGKKEKSGLLPIGDKGVGRGTLRHFIENYHSSHSDTYVVSEMPIPMFKDFSVPPPLTCGTMKDHFVEVDLWMSGGGTASILHKDAFNAINCVINGTKQWKMVEYKYEDKIYKAWEPPEMVGGFSKVQVNKVDLLKHPLVSDVKWSLLKINAGDCLYLPRSYYHQVSSSGTSNFAVALLFSRFDLTNDLDFSDCDKPLHPTPLSQMDLDWKYSGHGNLSMGNTDVWTVRQAFKFYFGDKKAITRQDTLKIAKQKMSKFEKENKLYFVQVLRGNPKMWFDYFVNDSGIITLDQINNLTRDDIRSFLLDIQGTDLTNTEEHEYGYVGYDDIRDIFKEFKERKEPIIRKRFIDNYIEVTAGTEKFASELFDKIDTNSDKEISPKELEEKLEFALEPYIRWGDANASRTEAENDDEDQGDSKNSEAPDDERQVRDEL